MKLKGSSVKWIQQAVFVGPAFAVFLLIIAVPFVMGMYYSFTSWDGISPEQKWVGLDNFKRILLEDTGFRDSFWFTLRYTICAVVLTNLFSFLLALALTRALKTRNMLRTLFYMPNVIGGLLLGFIWQFIFVNGFSAIGQWTGFSLFQLGWLGDSATAFWAVVIVTVWQSAGYFMVIYIASIINIPSELIEAARMDGANGFQLLKNVMLPLIMPSVTICLFLSTANGFKAFDVILSLTKGGPYGSTEPVTLNIYTEAFTNNHYGLGTAKAFLFFLAVALVTTVQVILTKRKEIEA